MKSEVFYTKSVDHYGRIPMTKKNMWLKIKSKREFLSQKDEWIRGYVDSIHFDEKRWYNEIGIVHTMYINFGDHKAVVYGDNGEPISASMNMYFLAPNEIMLTGMGGKMAIKFPFLHEGNLCYGLCKQDEIGLLKEFLVFAPNKDITYKDIDHSEFTLITKVGEDTMVGDTWVNNINGFLYIPEKIKQVSKEYLDIEFAFD